MYDVLKKAGAIRAGRGRARREDAGVIPERTTDPYAAFSLLEIDGAAILRWDEVGGEAATAAARAVLGDRLRAVRAPVAIGTTPVRSESHNRGPLHVDGYMIYGLAYPDVVFLLCGSEGNVGGDSFVVDGYRLLAQLADDPDQHDLLRFLWRTPIEQRSATGVPLSCPIASRTPGGRIAIRAHTHQRLADCEADDGADRRLLERWETLVSAAADTAPRFRLHAGEFLCLDNYRLFHGGEAYAREDRLLHRIWSWTQAAYAVPEPQLVTESQAPPSTIPRHGSAFGTHSGRLRVRRSLLREGMTRVRRCARRK